MGSTLSEFYDYQHTVAEDEIDTQGHVHNLRYLQWTLWAAGAHTRAAGWDQKAELEQGFGWVVRQHDVTYRAAAMAGDEIVIRTWVQDVARFASRRRYLICRPADQSLLARVETRWVYVDLSVHKVVAIPPNLVSQLAVCKPVPDLPWKSSHDA